MEVNSTSSLSPLLGISSKFPLLSPESLPPPRFQAYSSGSPYFLAPTPRLYISIHSAGPQSFPPVSLYLHPVLDHVPPFSTPLLSLPSLSLPLPPLIAFFSLPMGLKHLHLGLQLANILKFCGLYPGYFLLFCLKSIF